MRGTNSLCTTHGRQQLKKLLIIFAILGSFAFAQEPGEFVYIEQSDPITDADRSAIYVTAEEASLFSDARLYFRCDGDVLELFYGPDEFLNTNDPVPVQYRFDDDPASPERAWSSSTSGTAAFATPSQRVEFIAGAKEAGRVVMRATNYNGVTYTYTFDLSGFNEAFNRLGCSAAYADVASDPASAVPVPSSLTLGLAAGSIYARIMGVLEPGSYSEDVNVIYADGLTIRFGEAGTMTRLTLEGSNDTLKQAIADLFVIPE